MKSPFNRKSHVSYDHCIREVRSLGKDMVRYYMYHRYIPGYDQRGTISQWRYDTICTSTASQGKISEVRSLIEDMIREWADMYDHYIPGYDQQGTISQWRYDKICTITGYNQRGTISNRRYDTICMLTASLVIKVVYRDRMISVFIWSIDTYPLWCSLYWWCMCVCWYRPWFVLPVIVSVWSGVVFYMKCERGTF